MLVLPVQIFYIAFILTGTTLGKQNKLSTILKNYTKEISAAENAEVIAKHVIKDALDNWKINVTKTLADFRVQIVIHKNHTLGDASRENSKWNDCVMEKENIVKKIEETYSDNETDCIKNITAEITNKKKTIKQIIKEVNNWRKSFKYLTKLCENEHPYDISEAEICLKEYMQNDNFINVIYRLLNLLEDSKSDLKNQVNISRESVQKCLELGFSLYMDHLRTLMADLNECYTNKVSDVTTEIEKSVTTPGFDITRFRCTKHCE